ncbi:MAG: sulfite exporter TauE/SafE family protein [Ferruginibacter sp.]
MIENKPTHLGDKLLQADELATVLVSKQATLAKIDQPEQKKWPRIVMWCLIAFLLLIVGSAFLTYAPAHVISDYIKTIPSRIDTTTFLLMLLTGFIAQMADGSLGMGYGTIATTFLLAQGVNPAIVSSRVHSARVFSSGVSGYSHHRFGNINKKLFKTLVIPGVIGAAIGAAIAFFGQQYSDWIRLPLSIYTFYLGYFIISKAFKKRDVKDKVKKAGWLAATGGFMDAFAGGGWGTLVTSTLMTKRKSPRYVIGSVCLAEFFVVLTSSITFFILLKSIPLLEVAGLIIGGLIAAPIAARLVGKLPMKTMFVLVGTFVIIASSNTIWKAIQQLITK